MTVPAAFSDTACTDHLHVIVHELARRLGVARLDQIDQLGMDVENMLGHRPRQGAVAPGCPTPRQRPDGIPTTIA